MSERLDNGASYIAHVDLAGERIWTGGRRDDRQQAVELARQTFARRLRDVLEVKPEVRP